MSHLEIELPDFNDDSLFALKDAIVIYSYENTDYAIAYNDCALRLAKSTNSNDRIKYHNEIPYYLICRKWLTGNEKTLVSFTRYPICIIPAKETLVTEQVAHVEEENSMQELTLILLSSLSITALFSYFTSRVLWKD